MSWAAHVLMCLCRKEGCGGWSWELICPFVQHPWKLLVFETCLSSHPGHWMREKILCGLRNLFILWIFDLYVCYALLILSLVWPITAEEQLGHDILTLMWKKKENEASYSHISARNIYILDRKDHIHTAAQTCLLSAHAPTSTMAGTARTCSRVCRPCVHCMYWHAPRKTCTGFHTKPITYKAAMQNKVDGKGSICVSKGSWKNMLFSEQCNYICLFRDAGRPQDKEKKKIVSARVYRNS